MVTVHSPTFILVHGTWGTASPWTKPGSPLHGALLQLTTTDHIIRFVWSGRNTFGARRRASVELRRTISKSVSNNPQSPHFVIAHSHGGNVALSAFKSKRVTQVVQGIVCISTPFIVTYHRPLGVIGDDLAELLSFVVSPLILLGILQYIGLDVLSLLTLKWAGPFENHIVLFLMLLWGGLTGSIFKRASRQAQKLARIASPPSIAFGRMLVVRGTRDEANLALTATSFLRWLSRLFWSITIKPAVGPKALLELVQNRLYGSERTRRKMSSMLPVVLLISSLSLSWVLEVSPLEGLWLSCIFFVAMGVLVYAFAGLASALLIPLGLALAVLSLPYGVELATASLFLDISVEATPLGHHEVFQVRPGDSFSHFVYQEEQAVEFISKWLYDRLQLEQSSVGHASDIWAPNNGLKRTPDGAA